jgi:hypothetical protein
MKTFKYRLVTLRNGNGASTIQVKYKDWGFWCWIKDYEDPQRFSSREQAMSKIKDHAHRRRARQWRVEVIEDVKA